MKDLYKAGGASAFYKGSTARALKSALNIALQFFLYDSLKRLADVAPDDLKVMGCVASTRTGCCFFFVTNLLAALIFVCNNKNKKALPRLVW